MTLHIHSVMAKIWFLFVYTLFSILFFSCDSPGCRESSDISNLTIKVEHIALEEELRNMKNWKEMVAFLEENRTMSNYFLHAQQYPNDTILAKRLFKLTKDSYMDTLFTEVSDQFSDMNSIISEFENGYKRIKFNYPKIKIPKLQTVVTGFYNDLYISDSLIIVGLDYFVGSKGSYKPNDIPNYILTRYEKENMLPSIFTFISNDYNEGDLSHNTLLAEMINLGKSYYFVSQILTCTDESLIIGFKQEEMKLVLENQETIWASLIENEMLYETDNFMKNKFVGERPNVPEIDEKCPGRVGAWVGWEIVKAYMSNNPSITLPELMANKDAHSIFQQSRYRPKNLK